ncbi:MAG: DUF3592 domain-containing protein [Gammaproteobacteria bacterium]
MSTARTAGRRPRQAPALESAQWSARQRFGMVVIAVTSAWLGWMGLTGFWEGRTLARWREVTATVIESGVHGGGRSGRSAHVSYLYRVDGATYESSRLDLNVFSNGDLGGAEDIVARFPVGADVTAWYDPRNPGRATLVRDPAVGANSLLAIVSFAISGVCIWGRFFKRAA